jgi:arylsulfatase A-like enzyme
VPRIVVYAFALLCALAAGGCTSDGGSASPPNVLLITVDTLRADHLGAYGYDQPTSPAIDALAAQGVLVSRCVATAPETAPATASILTGLYQDQHLVTFNRAKLPADVTTLAERLRAAGYATAAFVGNHLIGAEYGFAAGFDTFEEFQGKSPIAARDHLGADLFEHWLASSPQRPWFAWIHFMDPHGPYTSADASVSADFSYPDELFGEDRPLPVSSSNFGLGVIPRYQRIADRTRPSQYYRLYDGEIRLTDAQIARVLAQLDEAAGAESTLVVLTADHGESLIEHDEYFQHGWFLYDTTVRVPLILRQPGRIAAASAVAEQVSAVDVAPTILALAGVDADAAQFDGRSFAAAIDGAEAVESRTAFVYGPRDNHPFAVSRDGWKLIHTPAGTARDPSARQPRTDYPTAERFELYDLGRDPAETADLSGRGLATETSLRTALRRFELRFSQRFWRHKQRLREIEEGSAE